MCSETVYDPALLGGGQPLPGQNLVIVVARPEYGYYVNVIVTNVTSTTIDFARVAVLPAGRTLGDEHWVAYDTELLPNQFFILPNVGLGPQDQIIGSSQLGFVSINVTGNKFYEV
jgi:hypothetical protein